MTRDADALIIGAGPAGCASAILLAGAGWQVVLVEQHAFPRQKVCGECISAGSLSVLDTLGIGEDFRRCAGPELRRVAWMGRRRTIEAEFPPCLGADAYGRALGRDVLDAMLLQRASDLGVDVIQPAKVERLQGGPGGFLCDIVTAPGSALFTGTDRRSRQTLRAATVIDAHGSWESGPTLASAGGTAQRTPRRPSDLFAFKASYRRSGLASGVLPVFAFHGGYGGLVVAEGGRTTLACCIRRDALHACRAAQPGLRAGEAVAQHLRHACAGLREVIDHRQIDGSWLSVGPIRPGIRVSSPPEVFRVGNAAGETHPLIGEGISMALQSAVLLAHYILQQPANALDRHTTHALNRRYAAAWRERFAPRLQFARAYASAAMRPGVAVPMQALLHSWPGLLTRAARWAGKARRAVGPVPYQALL